MHRAVATPDRPSRMHKGVVGVGVRRDETGDLVLKRGDSAQRHDVAEVLGSDLVVLLERRIGTDLERSRAQSQCWLVRTTHETNRVRTTTTRMHG